MSYDRTLRRVIDDALRLCGDFRGSGKNGRLSSWAECRDAVWACLLQIGTETGLTRDTRVIRLVAGQSVYTLPEDCLGVVSVTLSGLSSGRVVFPYALRDLDYMNADLARSGSPSGYYREDLAANEIAVVPVPGESGGAFSTTGTGTALVSLEDESGERLPSDEDFPVSLVSGDVAFSVAGDGGVLSAVWPMEGNLVVVYHRMPDCPQGGSDEIDTRIPYRVAKALKYGVAVRLGTCPEFKRALFELRWKEAVNAGISAGGVPKRSSEMRPL